MKTSAFFGIFVALLLAGCGGGGGGGGSTSTTSGGGATKSVTLTPSFELSTASVLGFNTEGVPVLADEAGTFKSDGATWTTSVPSGTTPKVVAGSLVYFESGDKANNIVKNYTDATVPEKNIDGDVLYPSMGTPQVPGDHYRGPPFYLDQVLHETSAGSDGTVIARNGSWELLAVTGGSGYAVRQHGGSAVPLAPLAPGDRILKVVSISSKGVAFGTNSHEVTSSGTHTYRVGYWGSTDGAFHAVTGDSPKNVEYAPVRYDATGGYLYNVLTYAAGVTAPTSVTPKYYAADGSLKTFIGLPSGAVIKEVSDNGLYYCLSAGYAAPATSVRKSDK